MLNRHLFLIGMQGCGKSSLGKRAARETGTPFVDTDALVVQSAGCSVNDFFDQYGEPVFRQAETNVLAELTRAQPMVVSTGVPRKRWSRTMRRSRRASVVRMRL